MTGLKILWSGEDNLGAAGPNPNRLSIEGGLYPIHSIFFFFFLSTWDVARSLDKLSIEWDRPIE